MKKGLFITLLVILVVIFFTTSTNIVFAAKNKGQSLQTLAVINNDGEDEVNGSILSPKADEVNILLSKSLLNKIRKIGLENLTCNLTSTLDSTKTFNIPSDAINIQRKSINKKPGKYLVVSLFNLTTQAGITISPSSLPSDNYRLRIQGNELDATTASFIYRTPALIVGTVDSNTAGLITVEGLDGEQISERTVATNPNGTFFTEVRAHKITDETKARKYLKAQTSDEETTEEDDEINTCVIHAVTDKDYYAIAPLDNDPENNAAKTEKPIKVNDSSSLNATLAIESAKEGDEELALETAKGIVEDLKSDKDDEEDEEFFDEDEDFECDIGDIGQFSDRCSDDLKSLASIGKDFREFISKANCSFAEFKLIKTIIPKLPEDANEFIGKGYCEISQESDDERPCDIYKNHILPDFKKGLIDKLPCPPNFCDEFSHIQPPKCFEPHQFCEESSRGPCIHKPVKDLYCARIDIDIKKEECKDNSFGTYSPAWTIESDDEGSLYCVPSNIPKPQYSSGYTGPVPPSTPKEIANECKINTCHNKCAEEHGFNFEIPQSTFANLPPTSELSIKSQKLHDCHFACDAEAGKIADCGNPYSKYFKKDCCNTNVIGPVLYTQSGHLAQSFTPGFTPGIIPVDIRSCLCKDEINNFNGKGYVKEEIISSCKNNCPEGFEKDLNSDSCLKICSKGLVRDPGGICRKKCPEGFIQTDFGGCACPDGLTIGASGKCESPSLCPPGQISVEEPVVCITTPCPLVKRCLCPDKTVPGLNGQCGGLTTTCSGNMLPNPNSNGEAQCTCPTGLPFWDGNANSCVAVCPNGPVPSPALPPKSPLPCASLTTTRICLNGEYPTSNNCQCASPAVPSGASGTGQCQCPGNYTGPYTATGCGSLTSLKYCEAGVSPSSGNCSCAPPGTPTGPNGTCTCPSGYSIAYSSLGCGSTLRYCSTSETPQSLVCQCAPGATATGTNGTCSCPNGQAYSSVGCSSSPTTSCSSNMLPNPNSNGEAQCTCPTGLPFWDGNANSCVAVCPNGPVPSPALPPKSPLPCASSTTTRICLNGEYPTSNNCQCASPAVPSGASGTGQCQCPANYTGPYTTTGCGSIGTTPTCPPGASVINSACVCGPHTIATADPNLPCTCASGATLASGVCSCTDSAKTYTVNGCVTSQCAASSKKIYDPAIGSCRCPNNSIEINGSCQCPATFVFDQNSSTVNCVCPSGTTLTNGTCQSQVTRTCYRGETYSSANPCKCGSGATLNASNVCQCPSGQLYTSQGCINNPTVTISSAVLSDNNMKLTFSSDAPSGVSCYDLFKGSSTVSFFTVCNSGANDLVLSAIASNGSSEKWGVGDSFKLCVSIDRTICSNTITATDGCTNGKTFYSPTHTCQCPSGQTETNGQCVAITAPNPPTNLVATASGSGTVALTWQDNSNNETSFKVYRQPNGAGGGVNWTLITDSLAPNTTTYTDSGVAPGAYQYAAYACNSTGCGISGSNAPSVTVP